MKKLFLPIALVSAVAFMGCSSEKAKEENKAEAEMQRYDMALSEKLNFFKKLSVSALNAEKPSSAEKIALGHTLYFDKRLSKNETQSCNSCHNLATFGVDNLPTSPGDGGQNGDRNSPTVLNAALHFRQFWDGRAKNVEEQAGMPILNPVEMGIPSEEFLVNRLKGIPEYQELFKKAFPDDKDPVSYTNLRNSIAVFERELLTPSRFDQYLDGKKDALTLQEKKGMMAFVTFNCTQCHSGELLGGNSFQKFGVFSNYWEHTKSAKIDNGKFAVTNDSLDLYQFKVPSLRNIEKTAPYFHDGSVASLDDAVRIMGKTQLNANLSDDDIANITAFLKSLTGTVPAQFTQAPK